MARSNAYSVNDLIENPVFVVESLFTDELWTERDLIIDSASTVYITFNTLTPLRIMKADYYNGSLLVNVTQNARYTVLDDNGSGVLTLDTIPSPSWNANDKCYIKNIQRHIDTDSFDAAGADQVETGTTTSASAYKLIDSAQNFLTTVKTGMRVYNSTDGTYSYVHSVDSNIQLTLEDDIFTITEGYQIFGTRDGWKFARSLVQSQSPVQIFNQLLYESHCIMHRSYKNWKIIALEDGNTVGTFSNPLTDEDTGRPKVFARLSPIENIFTDFTLNYSYNYAKKIYGKTITVNKNIASDVSLDSLKVLCKEAEEDYKITRKWEYNADWIYDDNTAYAFIGRIVNWLTYQRLLVEYWGDIKNHIQYEIGDRVLINYTYMMPTGINNSMVFMVYGHKIYPKKKVVRFDLIY